MIFCPLVFEVSRAVRAWTLGIMTPINNAMREYSKRMEENAKDDTSRVQFREAQAEWKKYAVGRAMIMMLSAIIGGKSITVEG